jgi:hypothetical protein
MNSFTATSTMALRLAQKVDLDKLPERTEGFLGGAYTGYATEDDIIGTHVTYRSFRTV